MTKEALGAIRIDLTVGTAKLELGLKQANQSFSKWSENAVRSLRRIEGQLGQLGGKLTRSVTAPLAAISVVAIRATDDSERVASTFKSLAQAMQNTLKPVGEALVQVIDTALVPALQRVGGVVKELADRFGRLEPQTQRFIVIAGAMAAAVGPLLLALSPIAVSLLAMAIALKPLIGLLLTATVATVKWTAALGGLKFAIAGILSFEIGRWLHDEFAGVQRVMARLIQLVEISGSTIRFWFEDLIGSMRMVFTDFVDLIRTELASIPAMAMDAVRLIPGRFRNVVGLDNDTITGMQAAAGAIGRAAGLGAGSGADRLRQQATERLARHRAEIEQAARVYNATIANIESEFAGQSRRPGGGGFVGFVGSDISSASSKAAEAAIAGLRVATGGLLDDLMSLLDAAPLPFEAIGEAAGKASPMIEKMRKEAMAIRLNVLPEENFREQLDRLEQFRNFFPEIIDEQVFAAKMEQLKKLLGDTGVAAETFSTKIRDTIQGFAASASQTFTKLLFDGKASFRELADSWARTLVQMAAQQLIFKPLFDALGTGISGIFANAKGNAFNDGRVVPFADGGVVSRPTFFGMRGGGLGLMGEAGPEAILPLRRIGGKLGVEAAGGGGVVVQIVDQRGSGERPQVSESTGPDGRKMLSILIRDEVRRGIGEGAFDRSFSQTFGIGRRGRPR